MRKWWGIAGGALAVGLLARARRRPGMPSLSMQAAGLLLKAAGKPLADIDAFRRGIAVRDYPEAAEVPGGMRREFAVHDETVAGLRCIVVAPRSGGGRMRIMYLHGGGYVNALIGAHWSIVRELVRATGATVTVPLYPLAPEHDHRVTWPFLIDVYRRMLTEATAGNIVFAGDSAGGGLSIGAVLAFREQGLPAPGRLILFSPWLDLTLANDRARAIEPRDPMLAIDGLRLCGQWWAGGDDPRSPRLSPLYADLDGMPPIDLYQGTDDLFVVDSRTFATRATTVGVPCDYREYGGAFHVFVGATFTPEARDVFRRIGREFGSGSGHAAVRPAD